MDDGSSCGAENSRASWTSWMDRHFIELMLEQVKKGSKTGSSFTGQGWEEIAAAFNSNLGFKYDIESFRNRQKTLRKHYNAIKTLLGENGFHWDHSRGIVIADDQTWNKYLEDHPDMKSYKLKAMPYYTELITIFGHVIADGRYSLSCYDAAAGEEELVMDAQAPTNEGCKKVPWTEAMDKYFFEIMKENSREVQNTGRVFRNKAWKRMTNSLTAKFGLRPGQVILRNRYNVLRRHYSCIKTLLKQPGFSWDTTLHMVVADASVWNECLKVNPTFICVKDKPNPHYNDMCTVFGNKIINVTKSVSVSKKSDSRNTESVKKKVAFSAQLNNADNSGRANSVLSYMHRQQFLLRGKKRQTEAPQMFQQSNKVHRENDIGTAALQLTDVPRSTKSCPIATKLCKKDPNIEEAMAKMLQDIEKSVSRLEKKNATTEDSIPDVMEALQAIPGIDDDLILDACVLLEDDRMAKMFLALHVNLRKKWLFRKLRPQ